MRFRPAVLAAALVLLLGATPALALHNQYLPVEDPLNAELRVLATQTSDPRTGLWTFEDQHPLPLGTRPLSLVHLFKTGWALDSIGPVRRIAMRRLLRELGRDHYASMDRDLRATPRLFEHMSENEVGTFQISTALEGGGEVARHADPRLLSGSGLHVRATAGIDGWLIHTHTVIGQLDGARAFADPIVPNSDFVAHTEDTYLAYVGNAWDARFGRSRWAWGPGEEGSLALSASGPAITGLSASFDLEGLHLRATALNATLGASAGEQLAAHRIEWQPFEALRLGATETARYRASGWQPLYAVGVIPYVFAQRLQVQDEPDSTVALRNNIQAVVDVAWRVADGTRVYGELLIDDLHAKSGAYPNKLGFQLGWDGAGAIGDSRVTWNGEYTRLTRYVYTSFFGRTYAAHGEPLGYFTGPDARRVRVRVSWDPGVDWQFTVRAARTDHGEGALDAPFVPGMDVNDGGTFDFAGLAERTRELEGSVRWWPASGVDVTLAGGWSWVDDAGHVRGASYDTPHATLTMRLTR
jgi:hypothetical protein